MNTIYIQIASYKDVQLIPTIESLMENAKYPENITICIAWQHGPEESIDKLSRYNNIKIIDIPYEQSLGACWARHQLQKKYNGEKYTLCLDSHHRFVKNWDEITISMYEQLRQSGIEKPLLTAYLPSFNPNNDPAERVMEPWKMNFDRFIPEGAVFFLPAKIENHESLTLPIPTRFVSAHFIFTAGVWNLEVPYDPNYYFHGEEINLAVRSYTHGYDLFHPHKTVCWHEYTRAGRTKQWDDDKQWHLKNNASHLRNRKLFGMDNEKQDIDFGVYGFGKKRTLEDYEKYAGMSFSGRSIQQYTLNHNLPPNPTVENWKDSLIKRFRHCIDIHFSSIKETDYDFWCVVFKDENDKDLYRLDADKNEIGRLLKDPAGYCRLWREFNCDVYPKKYVVWPHSVSKGWCNIIERNI